MKSTRKSARLYVNWSNSLLTTWSNVYLLRSQNPVSRSSTHQSSSENWCSEYQLLQETFLTWCDWRVGKKRTHFLACQRIAAWSLYLYVLRLLARHRVQRKCSGEDSRSIPSGSTCGYRPHLERPGRLCGNNAYLHLLHSLPYLQSVSCSSWRARNSGRWWWGSSESNTTNYRTLTSWYKIALSLACHNTPIVDRQFRLIVNLGFPRRNLGGLRWTCRSYCASYRCKSRRCEMGLWCVSAIVCFSTLLVYHRVTSKTYDSSRYSG